MDKNTYSVTTTFTFKGTFKIPAENEDEARTIVLEQCGLVLGGNIHSTNSDADWEFDMTPEMQVTDVTLLEE